MIPEDTARDILRGSGIAQATNVNKSWLVAADEVARLLKGTVGCENFTLPIKYEVATQEQSPNATDSLSLAEIEGLPLSEVNATKVVAYERLLQYCSAVGSGDLGTLNKACVLLGISTEWGGAWSVLRRLVLLGHLEFETHNNNIRWGMVEPNILTAADGGISRDFLVGQRTPRLMEGFGKLFEVLEEHQIDGPKRMGVGKWVDDSGFVTSQVPRIGHLGCVSELIVELLPAVDNWIKLLPVWEERDFGRYRIDCYDPTTEQFLSRATLLQPEQGLYRFKIEQGKRSIVTYAFFSKNDDCWRCGDLYGLRFVARQQAGKCRAMYTAESRNLVIPPEDRWPMPYERALVLASGRLPERLRGDTGVVALRYTGIPKKMAVALGEALQIHLEGE